MALSEQKQMKKKKNYTTFISQFCAGIAHNFRNNVGSTYQYWVQSTTKAYYKKIRSQFYLSLSLFSELFIYSVFWIRDTVQKYEKMTQSYMCPQ